MKTWVAALIALAVVAGGTMGFYLSQADDTNPIGGLNEKSSKEVAEWIEAGNVQARLGNYDKAVQFYELALEKKPKSPTVLINLTRVYLRQNKYEKGAEYLKQAQEIRPKHLPFRLQEAQLRRLILQFDRARTILKDLVKKRSDYLHAWIELASLELAVGNLNEAEAALIQARSRGAHPLVDMFYLRIHYERGDWAKVQADLSRLKREKSFAKVWEGRLLMAQNRTQEGITQLYGFVQEAREINLSDLIPIKVQLATMFRAVGEFERAQDIYVELVEEIKFAKGGVEDRFLPVVYIGMGQILLEQSKFAEAEAFWKKHLSSQPDHLARSARLWYGVTLAIQRKGKEARAEWKKLYDTWKIKEFSEISDYTRLQLLYNGKVDDKVPYLKCLGRRFRDDAPFLKGLYHWSRGEEKEAEKLWMKGRKLTVGGSPPYRLILTCQHQTK